MFSLTWMHLSALDIWLQSCNVSWLSDLSGFKCMKCSLVWNQWNHPQITWWLLKTKHCHFSLFLHHKWLCRMLPARNCLSVRITWPVLLLNESGENNVSEEDLAAKLKSLLMQSYKFVWVTIMFLCRPPKRKKFWTRRGLRGPRRSTMSVKRRPKSAPFWRSSSSRENCLVSDYSRFITLSQFVFVVQRYISHLCIKMWKQVLHQCSY